MKRLIILITFIVKTNFVFPQTTVNIQLKLSGFNNNDGKAYIMLLDDSENESVKTIIPISNKMATYTFQSLKPGKYAIKAFHDANNNGKLDTNILGVPKEKWGVSNNLNASFGPPNFKKMLFEVKSNTIAPIRLQ